MSFKKAFQHYKNADHLLTVTFPLIKDPKLFLGIIENILKVLEIYFDQLIETKEPSLEAKVRLLTTKNICDEDILQLALKLNSILVKHKFSPVEFRKKEMFVICNENYDLEIITVEELKLYLRQTKQLLDNLNRN